METEKELEILNNYLYELAKLDTHCKHCALSHDGVCFFAYECVNHKFCRFIDKKSLDNKK